MAYVHSTTRRNGLIDALRTAFSTLTTRYAQRQVYLRTCDELGSLSDYHLADLGLTRGQITTAARDASLGTIRGF